MSDTIKRRKLNEDREGPNDRRHERRLGNRNWALEL